MDPCWSFQGHSLNLIWWPLTLQCCDRFWSGVHGQLKLSALNSPSDISELILIVIKWFKKKVTPRSNPKQRHLILTVSTTDTFLIKVVYKENVSGYCSIAGCVMVAHSPLRFGLGAREEGLELLPRIQASCVPLLLISSPANQLLIPQVPLRSVPGSSGGLTSLSQ